MTLREWGWYCAAQVAQYHEAVNRDVITIDRASGLPIYLQIRHQLVYEIALGHLQAGAPLPSIRQLAASLRVTTVTVRHGSRSYRGTLTVG